MDGILGSADARGNEVKLYGRGASGASSQIAAFRSSNGKQSSPTGTFTPVR